MAATMAAMTVMVTMTATTVTATVTAMATAMKVVVKTVTMTVTMTVTTVRRGRADPVGTSNSRARRFHPPLLVSIAACLLCCLRWRLRYMLRPPELARLAPVPVTAVPNGIETNGLQPYRMVSKQMVAAKRHKSTNTPNTANTASWPECVCQNTPTALPQRTPRNTATRHHEVPSHSRRYHRRHEYTGAVDTNLDSLTCGEYTPVDASEALSEGRIIIGRIIGWGGDVIIVTGADTFEVTRCVARCACKGRIIGWGVVNLFRIIGWGGDVIIVHASSSLEESAPSGVRERVPPTL